MKPSLHIILNGGALGLRRFPAAGALVDLDCINQIGYVRWRGVASLRDLLTYSGGVGGTVVGRDGVIAAASGLRFDHDPSSYERLGLLVEEQRTNKCTNYNANPTGLTNVAGAAVSLVDDTAALAAAGLSSICSSGKVYKIDNSAGGTVAQAIISGQTGNTNAHTASAWARAETGSGSVGGGGAIGSTTFSTSTYSRVTRTGTPDLTTRQMVVNANPGSVVYFILNQFEEGSVASSVIPTSGAAVTATADSATLSLLGIWRDDLPVVLYSEADAPELSTSRVALCVNDGTASNRHQTGHAPAPFGVTAVGGVQVLNATAGSATERVASRACLSVFTDDGRVAGNGSLSTSDTSVAMPTGITTLRLGGITATNGTLGGHVRRAIVWQPGSRFPDALIQERTMP